MPLGNLSFMNTIYEKNTSQCICIKGLGPPPCRVPPQTTFPFPLRGTPHNPSPRDITSLGDSTEQLTETHADTHRETLDGGWGPYGRVRGRGLQSHRFITLFIYISNVAPLRGLSFSSPHPFHHPFCF